MSEGRCATCRHWDYKPNPWTPFKYVMAACQMTRHNGTYPEVEGTLANAFSMEEADSVLMTAPTFGCVQWEEGDV
jgi:hypothetical protein